MKHSIQPIRADEHGVLRFQGNPIVQHLLEEGSFGLNDLAGMDGFDQEDWEHFAQLIGYSLDGWGSLSYVSDTTFEVAEAMAHGESSKEKALHDRIEKLESDIRKVGEALGFKYE